MTNVVVLRKAIEKAEKNNYKWDIEWFNTAINYNPSYKDLVRFEFYKMIIFSYDFAKAFWGENLTCHNCGNEQVFIRNVELHYFCADCKVFHKHDALFSWQYHLQQMVLEKEPLKYLEKFLEIVEE